MLAEQAVMNVFISELPQDKEYLEMLEKLKTLFIKNDYVFFDNNTFICSTKSLD